MATGKARRTATRRARPEAASRPRPAALVCGSWRALAVSAVVLVGVVPGQRAAEPALHLSSTQSELAALHKQDAALAQEKKNLSDSGEIGRIARQQYQLVSPGQQAYEVLPPSGAASAGTPYAGDPGSAGSGDPVGDAGAPARRARRRRPSRPRTPAHGATSAQAPRVGPAVAMLHAPRILALTTGRRHG